MVNVQINGATISWTCLSSLYFVLFLGSPTSIHPHIRNILDSLFYISISSGEKVALGNYQTGLLFSIEGELPNWPISPFSPSSSNTKARPFELSHFQRLVLGRQTVIRLVAFGNEITRLVSKTFTTTILSRSIVITLTL